ncbi:MAG: hypothetical protein DHS80DRAFT_24920 [Piptocephalis tieghemiana]|nr:MAG: hypothetical protein DHS80DRAFT_24920 [Piptocephalis tieghemiana]
MHLSTLPLFATLILLTAPGLLASPISLGGGGGVGSNGGGVYTSFVTSGTNSKPSVAEPPQSNDPSTPYLEATWNVTLQSNLSLPLKTQIPYKASASVLTFPFALTFDGAPLIIKVTGAKAVGPPQGDTSKYRGTALVGGKEVNADLTVTIHNSVSTKKTAWSTDPNEDQENADQESANVDPSKVTKDNAPNYKANATTVQNE